MNFNTIFRSGGKTDKTQCQFILVGTKQHATGILRNDACFWQKTVYVNVTITYAKLIRQFLLIFYWIYYNLRSLEKKTRPEAEDRSISH